jgi:hypothetical protein
MGMSGTRWLAACAALWPLAAAAQVADEYAVKALFLANFALFTDWPASKGADLPVCVLGGDPLGAAAAKIEGRKVGERTLVTRLLREKEHVGQCAVVFVSRDAVASLAPLLDALRGKPVLTVGETEGLAQRGVMINMVLRNDKVSFEINNEAARQAGLAFSAKLLKLAVAVY